MEENDRVMEGRNNKGSKIFIAILILVILAGLGFGVYSYFAKFKNPRNVFMSVIDEVQKSSNAAIDQSIKLFNGAGADLELSFELSGSDESVKKLGKVLNNLTVKLNSEMDNTKKIINSDVDLVYNGSSVAKGTVSINNDKAYISVPDIFDKAIYTNMDEVDMFWEYSDITSYKNVVNKLINLVKKNLKDEYMSSTNEKITVLGKEVNALKQTLTIDGKAAYELEKNILSDILEDEELIKDISKLNGEKVEDIKSDIKNEIKDLRVGETKTTIDIYLASNQVQKLMVTSEESVIALEKSAENTFDVLVGSKESKNKLGTLELTDTKTSLNLDYAGSKANISLEKNKKGEITKSLINIASNGTAIEISFLNNGNNSNGYISVNANGLVNAKINIKETVKENVTVSEKTYADAVDANKLTENDMNKIMTNLQKNQTLLTLIQDLNNK